MLYGGTQVFDSYLSSVSLEGFAAVYNHCLLLPPFGVGFFELGLCSVMRFSVFVSSLAIKLLRKKIRLLCFGWCFASLPFSSVDWSIVCD